MLNDCRYACRYAYPLAPSSSPLHPHLFHLFVGRRVACGAALGAGWQSVWAVTESRLPGGLLVCGTHVNVMQGNVGVEGSKGVSGQV